MNKTKINWGRTLQSLLVAASVGVPQLIQGADIVNWTAYNEHASGPLTAANVTLYNMRGFVLGGDPGTLTPLSGPLKNFVFAGYLPGHELNAQLVVSTLDRNPDLFPNAAMGFPFPNTPAYDEFMPGGVGIVDLQNAGSGIGLGNFVNGVGRDCVVLTFNNLDPSMRYSVRSTIVRNGTALGIHSGRWSICSIVGTATPSSFTDAATAGVITVANVQGVPGLTLTNGQQIFRAA